MTFQPMAAWLEIPVSDLEASKTYYDQVFGWSSMMLSDMGPNPIVVLNGADVAGGGHLYPGKSPEAGTGATMHLTVNGALEDAIARVEPAGGQVVGPIVEIPSGRFQYTLDLDGNSIGLFEVKAA